MQATDFLDCLQDDILESDQEPYASRKPNPKTGVEVCCSNFESNRQGNKLFITENLTGKRFCLIAIDLETNQDRNREEGELRCQ